MSNANRIAISLCSLLWISAPAFATDPLLLAEFGIQDLDPALRSPLPGREFWWQVFGVTPNDSAWEVTVLDRQNLQSVLTPLGSVFQTTNVIAQPTDFYPGWNCGNCSTHPNQFLPLWFTADQLFSGLTDSNYGRFAHAAVPQLGPDFTGYHVTMATLTLTEAYPFSMSVKLYGQQMAVPEPSSLVLVLLGCVSGLRRRIRLEA